MSRSRKDGRRGGGHLNTQNREVWSRRCAKVNMWPIDDADYKRITHRHERRQAKQWIASELDEPPITMPPCTCPTCPARAPLSRKEDHGD